MKKAKQLISAFLLISLLAAVSCGGDGEKAKDRKSVV